MTEYPTIEMVDTMLAQLARDRKQAYWADRTDQLNSAESWLQSMRDWLEGFLPAPPTAPHRQPSTVNVNIEDLTRVLNAVDYVTDRSLVGPVDRLGDQVGLARLSVPDKLEFPTPTVTEPLPTVNTVREYLEAKGELEPDPTIEMHARITSLPTRETSSVCRDGICSPTTDDETRVTCPDCIATLARLRAKARGRIL